MNPRSPQAPGRPLVSVVSAAYEALDPLRATVASVAGQSFPDREHVVVDGGSTDGTRAFLEGLGEAVAWVSEPDDGIADALNKGVAMARGEYVLVLQAGDVFVAPDSLARAVPHLDPGPDILVCDVTIGGRGPDRLVSTPAPTHRLAFKPVCHQGVFCRRTVFARIGGFDPAFRVCMDYDFLLRARRAGMTLAHAPVRLARMDDGGISSRRDWPSLARRFAEERRIHLAHCPGPVMRAVYAVYWPPYLAYRRARALLAGD